MSDTPQISDRLRQKREQREARRALREAARTDPAARREMLASIESRYAEKAASGNYIPKWIRYMENDHGPWGFFIYRCACYENPTRWERYRAALDRVWENSWNLFWESQREMGVTEEMFQRVKQRMELRWIEDEALEGQGVDEVRRRFKLLQNSMPSLDDEPRLGEDPWNLNLSIPYHMDRYVCLYVDEDAISSLIGTPGQEVSSPEGLHDQEEQARDSYIIAVDSEYNPDYEGYLTSPSIPEPYPGWVKIFAGLIFTELCPRRTYINDLVPLDSIYKESHGPLAAGNGIWYG